jgi:hypothetical protein
VARIHVAECSDDAPFVTGAIAAATRPGEQVRARIVERAPAAAKSAIDVWGQAPASLPLMRELKRRFDPAGVLSPGRLAGGL